MLAKSRPVGRFGGQNKLLRGQDLFSLRYMFKTSLSGHNNIWVDEKFRDTAPECSHGYKPGLK